MRIQYFEKMLSATDREKIKLAHPDGTAHIWGVKPERVPQWARLFPEDCLVLFRQGGRVVLRGVITYKMFNPALAKYLWGEDENGELWSLVYLLNHVVPVDIRASRVNDAAGFAPGWDWRGFITIEPPRAHAVIDLVVEHER